MLEGIKQFFLSRFWKERYLRRINEEGMLDRYSQFPEINVRIKFIFENKNLDGRAYNSTIEINLNKHPWKDDIEYLENTLIHADRVSTGYIIK